jgi:hypothetical protein
MNWHALGGFILVGYAVAITSAYISLARKRYKDQDLTMRLEGMLRRRNVLIREMEIMVDHIKEDEDVDSTLTDKTSETRADDDSS